MMITAALTTAVQAKETNIPRIITSAHTLIELARSLSDLPLTYCEKAGFGDFFRPRQRHNTATADRYAAHSEANSGR
ncbi:hypothetical protein EZMO1_4727 [Endozoicomonas montiporae CL-33]|uniref:Uncharacterized protein n=1 Tax=Endozoicomonas montiporae CL-33 TaxID=570277 RepID=A0A142BIQ2_9GAMM|nr:hypothetical protein EZMO1_4727 [Endozoicomonas montiporae CL-33]